MKDTASPSQRSFLAEKNIDLDHSNELQEMPSPALPCGLPIEYTRRPRHPPSIWAGPNPPRRPVSAPPFSPPSPTRNTHLTWGKDVYMQQNVSTSLGGIRHSGNRDTAEAERTEVGAQTWGAKALKPAQRKEEKTHHGEDEVRHLEERLRLALEEAEGLEERARQAETSAKMLEIAAQQKEAEIRNREAEVMRFLAAVQDREAEVRRLEVGVRDRDAEVKRREAEVQDRETRVRLQGEEASRINATNIRPRRPRSGWRRLPAARQQRIQPNVQGWAQTKWQRDSSLEERRQEQLEEQPHLKEQQCLEEKRCEEGHQQERGEQIQLHEEPSRLEQARLEDGLETLVEQEREREEQIRLDEEPNRQEKVSLDCEALYQTSFKCGSGKSGRSPWEG